MSQITFNLDPVVRSFNKIANTFLLRKSNQTNLFTKKNNCSDICPPRYECPPRCLLSINRTAKPGERIIVTFNVKNQHLSVRQYKIGIRPLVDDQGQIAPSQPLLDTRLIELQPGQSRMITMIVELTNFKAGQNYQTDIVVREDKFNQNICFALCISDSCNTPTAYPWDERIAYNKWLGWQRHFMCTPHDKEVSKDC